MDQDKKNRVIATIKSWFPRVTREYLGLPEDEQKSPPEELRPKALKLAVTLKHFAKPLSNFPNLLEQDTNNDSGEELAMIVGLLKNPRKILPCDKSLQSQDEPEIKALMQGTFNDLADELIKLYNLQNEAAIKENEMPAPSAPPLEEKEERQHSRTWWDRLTPSQQAQAIEQYQNLTPEQKTKIAGAMSNKRVIQLDTPRNRKIDPYDLYWVSRITTDITLNLFNDAILAYRAPRAIIGPGSMAVFNGDTVGCCSGSCTGDSCGNCNDETLPIIAAIIGVIALATAALGFGLYGLKKTFNSVVNLFNGDKPLRSLWRLAGIGAGAYVGATECGVLGAYLGSIIPGFGTAAGFVFGTVCGALIGSGLGALAAKYSAKAISYLFNYGEINPTNPDKYKLTQQQEDHLIRTGAHIPTVNRILAGLKETKGNLSSWSSIPFTSEREQKDDLNQTIKDLKNGLCIDKVFSVRGEPQPIDPYKPISGRFSLFALPVDQAKEVVASLHYLPQVGM